MERSDILIIGGGLAGIATALDLLDGGSSVLLVDRDEESAFGGLARESFGGMFFVDSPEQRRQGIRDSADLALHDWCNFAEFGAGDRWPRAWAEKYVSRCSADVDPWVRSRGVSFLPVLQGKTLERDRPLYWQYDRAIGPWKSAVRVGSWKLLADAKLEKFALYNLADDPAEKTDVIAKHPEELKKLTKALRDAHASVTARK